MIPASAAIHQPHFLPWAPYVAKLYAAETFIVQDDVRYRKQYYHNRTRLLQRDGRSQWATLPIRGSAASLFRDVQLDVSKRRLLWRVRNLFLDSYCASEFFESLWPEVETFLVWLARECDERSLAEINLASIKLTMNAAKLRLPRIQLASDLPGTPDLDRTERIVGLLDAVRATTLIVGWGSAVTVHDVDVLKSNGVRVLALSKAVAESLEPEVAGRTGLTALHWCFHERPEAVARQITNLTSQLNEI